MTNQDDQTRSDNAADRYEEQRPGEERPSEHPPGGSSLPPGSSSRTDDDSIAGMVREDQPYDDGDPSGKLSPGAPNPAPPPPDEANGSR